MHHVAIMKKSWKLIDKIVSGEKTIESRWYQNRRDPYHKIKSGDVVYFKDSGEPVTAKADVERVLEFSDLTPQKVDYILKKYGKRIWVNYHKDLYKNYEGKNYCILVFMKNMKYIKSFNINKKGYGNASAWLCVDNISRIKLKN